MLQSQLGSLLVEADAEMPSTLGHELDWLTCKTLLAQILVFDPVLVFAFAIDLNPNIFAAYFFVQDDFDVGICSFAVF